MAKLLGSRWEAPKLRSGTGGAGGKIGEYCRGRHLEECRALFGDRLSEICAGCPD